MIYETFRGSEYRAREVRTDEDGTVHWAIEYDQEANGRYEHRAGFTQRGSKYFLFDDDLRDAHTALIRYLHGKPS